MNYLMIHDIRDIDENFFPDRYRLPYFFRKRDFVDLVERFPPLDYCHDTFQKDGFVYTFDDGLKDHIFAAEHLNKIGKRGIFFIPAAPVIIGEIIDSNLIQFIMASADLSLIESELLRILRRNDVEEGEIEKYYASKWKINTWSREMVFITRCLREYGTRSFRTNALRELYNGFCNIELSDLRKELYLTPSDVEYISSLGHLIGGHGYNSFDLRYATDAEVASEISRSKEFLESIGVPRFYYAFANGGVTDVSLDFLEKNGFEKAFTTTHEFNSPSNSNYLLPRIDPSKPSPNEYSSPFQCSK